MDIKEKGSARFVETVFERPSIRKILADGVVTEEEIREQEKLVRSMYEKLAADMSPDQIRPLEELLDEVGVLFTVTIFHNLRQN